MTTHASTMPALLEAVAQERPDRAAARVDGGNPLTYGEWSSQSSAVARALRGIGVRPADKVIVSFAREHWIEHLVAYIAVQKAGAVPVVISSESTEQERRAVVQSTNAQVMLVHERPPSRQDEGTHVVAVAELAELETRPDAGDASAWPSSGDIADILFTSGSTGVPKGVATTHENLLATAGRLPAPWRGKSFLHVMPPWSALGAQGVLTLQLRGEMSWATLRNFDPVDFCALAQEEQPYLLYLVPAIAALLADTSAPIETALDHLEVIMLLGSAPPRNAMRRLAERIPHVVVLNVYGLTEAGGAQVVGRYDPATPDVVGRAVGATQVSIVDGDQNVVRTGDTGEIRLRRMGVRNREYYGDRLSTEKVFHDGWVRTGDLGFVDAHQNLHVLGRIKDIIISGGTNISAREVEDAFREHPAVVDVAVIGRQHEILGETVAAAVVVTGSALETDLLTFMKQRLSRHKVPTEIIVVDAIPRNAVGKIVKPAVAALFRK
jgi:acyl-CoA synthetase (AMP-forming)/AMP-acid ligase II